MTDKPIVALFMGPPGAGKGTLSEYCRKELGWHQLSTGDLLRKHIARQTELGKQIDFMIKSGKLVSDELINAMVEDWLKGLDLKPNSGIILDGYPRTLPQAEALAAVLEKTLGNIRVNVVRLQLDSDLAVSRMSSRLICQNKDCQAVYSTLNGSSMQPQNDARCDKCGSQIGRRKDDQKEVIQDRIATYNKHEKGLLRFYDQIGLPIVECNAGQSIKELFGEFKKLMNIH